MTPTSPRQIQIDPHLPTPNRSHSVNIGSPNALSPSRALGPPQPHAHRQSITGRSYRDDPEGARERQMQQDIESAMSMSRARSGSMAAPEPSPGIGRTSQMHFPSTSPIDEGAFPMLSDAEEAEMDRARQSGFRGDHDGQSEDGHGPAHYHVEEEERADHAVESVGGSSGYDSHARLLRRRGSDEDSGSHRLRMEHRHPGPHQGPTRNVFDFGAMEDFAKRERDVGPGDRPEVYIPNGRGDLAANDQGNAIPSSYDTVMDRTNPMSAFGDDHETAFSPKEAELGSSQQGFHRRRQRKLSQSNPVHRRQGKLALFEGFGSQGAAAENETGEGGQPFKAARQPKHLGPNGNGFATYTDAAPGHDRPYRFSFYSNALPVTIHARSLAELPAEGQTFEDLFKGRNEGMEDDRPSNPEGTDYGSIRTSPRETESTTPTGQESAGQGAKLSMLARAAGAASKGNGAGGGPPNGTAEEDPEAFTFWLDVLSPTDEEMRMLSKDILLEETREKIELFRNYYLVCFRSFDQDPYSQTYLEPLNMYIIVFREGTLSFHFRGTPHPQNVRRRIKHLKDYISVTSDWISYALIDDITDAFGPLIQSIEYEVDSIDELVLILKEAEQSDMLRRIGTCRKKVMGLLRLMGNKADVVKGLAKRCNEQWLVAPKSDIGLYLSDIQDHLITMTQNLNHYEKILSRSHSNYLAQISIEMTDANNQINDVLSKLTALGTVLIPMNLVTGLWGMNVHVPGQDISEGYAWFGGILGCLAAFALLGAWATYKCFVR